MRKANKHNALMRNRLKYLFPLMANCLDTRHASKQFVFWVKKIYNFVEILKIKEDGIDKQ